MVCMLEMLFHLLRAYSSLPTTYFINFYQNNDMDEPCSKDQFPVNLDGPTGPIQA